MCVRVVYMCMEKLSVQNGAERYAKPGILREFVAVISVPFTDFLLHA